MLSGPTRGQSSSPRLAPTFAGLRSAGRRTASVPRGPSLWATPRRCPRSRPLPASASPFLRLSSAQQPGPPFTLWSPHPAPRLQASDSHGGRGEAKRPRGARALHRLAGPLSPTRLLPQLPVSGRCSSSPGPRSLASVPSGRNVLLLPALPVSSCSASGLDSQVTTSKRSSHPKSITHSCTPRWCCTHHPSSLPCFIPLHCIRQHLTYDSLFSYLRRCPITTPYTFNLPRTWVS